MLLPGALWWLKLQNDTVGTAEIITLQPGLQEGLIL